MPPIKRKKKLATNKRISRSENSKRELWELRLYIAGHTPNSAAAIHNLKTICEQRLRGLYRIEVIDLLQNPQLAKGDQILAIPTLVRNLPKPVKQIIGNLSKGERVLVGLDIKPSPG